MFSSNVLMFSYYPLDSAIIYTGQFCPDELNSAISVEVLVSFEKMDVLKVLQFAMKIEIWKNFFTVFLKSIWFSLHN